MTRNPKAPRWLYSAVALVFLGVASLAGADDYQIGPRDRILVTVFGEDDLSGDVPVDTDGNVNLPLLGHVEVAGLTAREIETKVRDLYQKDFLHHPQVEVRVQEYRSQTVRMLGAVNKPGLYPLEGSTKLLDVLAKAGGAASGASRHLLIIRASEAQKALAQSAASPTAPASRIVRTSRAEPVRVDLRRLTSGDLGQNLAVHDGDLLFVPRAQEVYLLGEIKRPGSIVYGDGVTLLQAISKAGGFTKVAQERKVQVIRIEEGKEVQRTFNMKKVSAGKSADFPLQPEDLIVVPESIL